MSRQIPVVRPALVALLAALGLTGANLLSNSAHGTVDASFDADGKATIDFSGDDAARDVAVQPDGAIVIAGFRGNNFAVARLNTDGSLDTSFNDVASPTASQGDGRLSVTFGGMDLGQAVALQRDGKIVVAGYTNTTGLGENDFAVIRLNANGTLDTSFNPVAVPTTSNGDGRITIDFGADDRATGVAIARDGKIIVAGTRWTTNTDFAVAVLNANGTLDTTFSTDGKQLAGLVSLDACADVAVDAEGRIVLVGSSDSGSNTRIAVARLTTAGALDTTFNGSGFRTIDLVDEASAADDGEDAGTGVAIQPDGKIVVAAYGGTTTGNSDFVVIRLNASGSDDTGFNDVTTPTATDGDGKQRVVVGPSGETVERTGHVALLHNGKIAVAGSVGDAMDRTRMAVLVLDPDGTVDGTFSADGELLVDFGGHEQAVGIAVQPDGALVLAGETTGASGGSTRDFAVARIGGDPPTDPTFSTDGYLTNGRYSADLGRGVVVEPGGTVVIAGTGDGPTTHIEVFRHLPDGRVDATFGTGAAAILTLGGASYVQALARQPDGKLILVGYTDRNATGGAAGYYSGFVARLNADGSIDTAFNNVISPTSSNGDGIALIDIGESADAVAVALQPDGHIVVAGTVLDPAGTNLLVYRLTSAGRLDTDFSPGAPLPAGITEVSVSTHDRSTAVAIQPDGKILVAGHAGTTDDHDFCVVRLNANGSTDTSFAGDARATIDFGGEDRAHAIALQPDGKVVVAGSATATTANFAVARLTAGGVLDDSFSGDGRVAAAFGVANVSEETARALVLLPDGTLLVAGYSDAGGGLGANDFAVLKLNTNGSIDTSFANAGKLLLDFGDDDRVYAAALDPAAARVFLAGQGTHRGDIAVASLPLASGGAPPPTLPTLSIGDASIVEGNSGMPIMSFTVTLSATPSVPVMATVTTANGSATTTDYMATSQGVLFLPGATTLTQTVSVRAFGDEVDEPVESFTVNLGDVSGATILDGQGVGTIVDDDVRLEITTPAITPFASTSAVITVAGAASDSGGVQQVTWATSLGESGTAAGTGTWAAQVPLAKGTNVITVTATGASGFTASTAVTVTVDTLVYYLAEGATQDLFGFDLLIANPNTVPAPVTIRYLLDDGTTVDDARTLPATSRTTIHVDDVPDVAPHAVSTVVTSTEARPLVVERSMFWDVRSDWYGSHAGSSVAEPGRLWMFAEGSQGYFDTYVLLANALDVPAHVTVTFLLEFEAPVVREYLVGPTSRANVYAGEVTELSNKSFSIVVDADVPIIAERAMYFGTPLFNGGHESAGVQRASQAWFLAEGATGVYFDTYVLIANPNDSPATATLTFLTGAGVTVTKTVTVDAKRRFTVNIEDQDPALANDGVATTVVADVPVIVERAMYWPGGGSTWYEAHNSFGVTETATLWGLAEGRCGGPHAFQTYILLANPSTTTAAEVRVTYLKTDGTTVVKTYTVDPTKRYNVDVNLFVPELAEEEFGAIVEVTNGVPIAVERALYNDAGGVSWAAGSNATAVRLPALH